VILARKKLSWEWSRGHVSVNCSLISATCSTPMPSLLLIVDVRPAGKRTEPSLVLEGGHKRAPSLRSEGLLKVTRNSSLTFVLFVSYFAFDAPNLKARSRAQHLL